MNKIPFWVVCCACVAVVAGWRCMSRAAGVCQVETRPDGSTVFYLLGGGTEVYGPGARVPPVCPENASISFSTPPLEERLQKLREQGIDPFKGPELKLRPGPLPPVPRLPNGMIGYTLPNGSVTIFGGGCGTPEAWTEDGLPVIGGAVAMPINVHGPLHGHCEGSELRAD